MIDWTRLTPAVERAAGIAKSNFPAHHDVSDVKQELWVWIMENKNTVTGILTGPDASEAALIHLLVKAAQTFLKAEDAATYGYLEEDQFFYSLDLIKSILEVVFRHEDWQSFATAANDMPKAKADPSKTGNNLASYADVKSAVERLPTSQYNLIVWRYKYQYTLQRLGTELGITRHAARGRLDTAHEAIQKDLGRRDLGQLRNGYDGRTADSVTRGKISNTATAQYIIERDYEG